MLITGHSIAYAASMEKRKATYERVVALTDRQEKMLSGELPMESYRLTDVAALVRKTEEIGDEELFIQAKDLYQMKKYPTFGVPQLSKEESMAVLQSLTPWEIEWDKPEPAI